MADGFTGQVQAASSQPQLVKLLQENALPVTRFWVCKVMQSCLRQTWRKTLKLCDVFMWKNGKMLSDGCADSQAAITSCHGKLSGSISLLTKEPWVAVAVHMGQGVMLKEFIIISYHIISYHIISYHIISYIISYHIISYHIISYHIIYTHTYTHCIYCIIYVLHMLHIHITFSIERNTPGTFLIIPYNSK